MLAVLSLILAFIGTSFLIPDCPENTYSATGTYPNCTSCSAGSIAPPGSTSCTGIIFLKYHFIVFIICDYNLYLTQCMPSCLSR